MNTRRIPFQFSSTDPLARQKELEKRFGLQPTCPEMYVDVNNPLLMGSVPKETSSPRFQHRVPIFTEGYDQPVHSSSVDSMASVPENKKPNVRIIPIEVEGADSRSPRHRTYSGPADTLKDRCDNLASERIDRFPFKRCNFEDTPKVSKPKLSAEPRVYNIPIKVEGANDVSKNCQPKVVPKSPTPKPKVVETPKPKNAAPVAHNGCSQSKLPSKAKSPKKDDKLQTEIKEKQEEQPKNSIEISLKKIEDVLTEFKSYETAVAEFTGTSKDKQYRYLDEMLTRCMLRLDDIDTMGNEEIRLSRKSAVKKVQASIDLLESKANVQPVASTEVPEVQSTTGEGNDNDIEMQDNAVTSTENESSDKKEMDLPPSDTKDLKPLHTVSDRTENEVESSQVASETTNNVTDVEMNEISQEKVDHASLDKENSSFPTTESQNDMPEVEMTEEISLDKVNSTSDLIESDSKNTVQNEVISETATDVEMMDGSTSVEAKESLSIEKTAETINDVNKINEVTEVEMVDIQDVSSIESEKSECETVEKPVHNSECSEPKTNNEVDDISCDQSEKDEREAIEKPVHNSECSELKTNNEVNDCISSKDSSFK